MVFQFATEFMQLFLGICMVRLLSPEDYGVLGMLAIFWAISRKFVDGGFGSALIQKKEVTEEDYCSVFYYNLFLSAFFCLVMAGSASWIADFFNQPILKKTILVSMWILPLGAVITIQHKMLQRSLRQGLNALITMLTILPSGAAALYLAWKGYGVWALVWQPVIVAFCRAVLFIYFVRWRPRLIFSFKALKSLFSFGSKILFSELLDAVFMNLNSVVIGKFYKAELLGYYSKANTYVNCWPNTIQSAISTVLFPAFSKIQDDIPRLKNAFRRSLGMSIFAVVFPSYLLCALSKPLVELVFTPRWLPCVPYWWMITCTIVFWPIHVLNLQLLTSRGRSDLYLLLESIKKGLTLFSVVILAFYGLMAMLWFGVFASAFGAYLDSYFTAKELGYGLFKQLRDVMVYIVLSLISCLAAWGFYALVYPHARWVGFLGAAALGCVCYGGMNLVLKTSASIEFIQLLAGRFPPVKKLLGRLVH